MKPRPDPTRRRRLRGRRQPHACKPVTYDSGADFPSVEFDEIEVEIGAGDDKTPENE
jgi:hypothetical protein